mmetsp:Transcript_36014/g.82004  ORF Transcript_36014/g.82004 Transcript_36014/m.82004 type:complete len:212 (-) Transcript_36014:276-911(-)
MFMCRGTGGPSGKRSIDPARSITSRFSATTRHQTCQRPTKGISTPFHCRCGLSSMVSTAAAQSLKRFQSASSVRRRLRLSTHGESRSRGRCSSMTAPLLTTVKLGTLSIASGCTSGCSLLMKRDQCPGQSQTPRSSTRTAHPAQASRRADTIAVLTRRCGPCSIRFMAAVHQFRATSWTSTRTSWNCLPQSPFDVIAGVSVKWRKYPARSP